MKNFLIGLALLFAILLVGCEETTIGQEKEQSHPSISIEDTHQSDTSIEDSHQPDISIGDIDWIFENGNIQGTNCVVLQFTNNSNYTIDSFELKFEEKTNLSKEEKSQVYADIQNSQGFDDEWMNEYIASREKLNQPMTMYGRYSEPTLSNYSSEKIKCYYMGGWTSKEVLHAENFEPVTAIIEYTKEDTPYTLYYNFKTQTYDLESE